MNKGALHYQEIPGWAKQLKQGRAFLINPPAENPFPGATVYGRTYLEDNASNALVLMGEAGAELWYAKFKDQYERAKYIEAWASPNEPPVDTLLKRQMLARFLIRFGQLMHAAGHKVIGGNFSVWWLDLGTAMDLASALPFLDYIGFHEYGYPSMRTDMPGRKCLHYRTVRAEWLAGGVKNIPPFIIDEAGEDDGQKHGWKTFAKTEDVYLADLQWYADELAKDDYVLAFFVFTAGPQGWGDFEVTESLGKAIASPTAFVPPPVVPPVVPPTDRLVALLKTAFGVKFEDLRASLPHRGTFGKRDLAAVTEIVVHHSAGSATLPWATVAQYEMNDHPTWAGIAYTIGVSPAGTVSLLADIDEKRGATGNSQVNAIAFQVCCGGNYENDTPTAAMLAAVNKLVTTLCTFTGRTLKVLGHRDVPGDQTACPGAHLYAALFAPSAPPTGGPSAVELLAAGEKYQVLRLNPGAALQQRIYRDGFSITSNEFPLLLDGVSYVCQRAEELHSGTVRVYFATVGRWDDVKFVERSA